MAHRAPREIVDVVTVVVVDNRLAILELYFSVAVRSHVRRANSWTDLDLKVAAVLIIGIWPLIEVMRSRWLCAGLFNEELRAVLPISLGSFAKHAL